MKNHPYYERIGEMFGAPVYQIRPGCDWVAAIMDMASEAKSLGEEASVFLYLNGVYVPVFATLAQQVISQAQTLKIIEEYKRVKGYWITTTEAVVKP